MSEIKDARIRQGLSQQELAEKAHVSRTIISGLETGRITTTTTGTLRKIAKALNTTISDIFFT